MRPFESTICQCGSGVSGTTKSSDTASRLRPSLIVWVTVPPFTFAPENGLLVCDCAAAVPARARVATATSAAWNNWDFIRGFLLLEGGGRVIAAASVWKVGCGR